MRALSLIFFIGVVSSLAEDRPNIVWIVSEDNSPLIGAYGDPLAQTPNIDALAEGGVRFSKAYANAPVCAPSRSSLITGKYASSLGSEAMRCRVPMPDHVHPFPYYLKQAGYFTTNREKKDYNTPVRAGTWDCDDWWKLEDAFVGHRSDQPYFLMYNTWMTHEGRMPKREKGNLRNYLRRTLRAFGYSEENAIEEADQVFEKIHIDPDVISLPGYHPDIPAIRKDWAHYYKCIALMDYEVGLVLEHLESKGLLENTIVFYLSDHGGVLPRSKRFLYESGLQVPLVVHLPKAFSAHASVLKKAKDQMIQFIDLAPTVLELGGVKIPDHLDGQSLFSEPDEWPEYTYAFRGRMDERYGMVRSVSDGRFRYSRNYYPYRKEGGRIHFMWRQESVRAWKSHFEAGKCTDAQSAFWLPASHEALFDTESDWDNTYNLVSELDYKDELNRLRSALDQWMLETKDTGVFPEPMLYRLRGDVAPWDWVRQTNQPIEEFLEIAKFAVSAKSEDVDRLVALSESESPVIRYWSGVGFCNVGEKGELIEAALIKLADDEYESVKIVAAEAFYRIGEVERARAILSSLLQRYSNWVDLEGAEYFYEDLVILMAMNVIEAQEEYALGAYPFLRHFSGKKYAYPSILVRGLQQ